MILYKNVDLSDLESILQRGILSLDESENDNWESRRAPNRTDVVYLFSPLTEQNSFTQYGAALIECECEGIQNDLLPQDVNNGLYEEYIVDRVLPEQIRAIYVPEIFKERLTELAPAVLEQITFCKMTAEIWDNSINGNEKDCFGNPIPGGHRRVTEDELLRFAQTASLNTWQLNYFRGEHENREVFDLEHIVYRTKEIQI